MLRVSVLHASNYPYSVHSHSNFSSFFFISFNIVIILFDTALFGHKLCILLVMFTVVFGY